MILNGVSINQKQSQTVKTWNIQVHTDNTMNTLGLVETFTLLSYGTKSTNRQMAIVDSAKLFATRVNYFNNKTLASF